MVKYVVTVGGRKILVEIEGSNEEPSIKVDGVPVSASVVTDRQRQKYLMLLDAKSFDCEVVRENGNTTVNIHGWELDCKVEDERIASIREVAGAGISSSGVDLKAPMPGLVLKVLCSIGEVVKRGCSLLIVEAMKMENELKSPADGKIVEINAVPGKPIDKGQVLLRIEP